MTTPQTKASAAEVLRKARARLGPNGERWIQRQLDRGHGEYCCSVGAIWYSSPNEELDRIARTFLARAIDDLDIAAWNDSPSRIFPEVREAFERAITLAEKGEAS